MMKVALLLYAIAITVVAIVLLTISQFNNKERNHYDRFYGKLWHLYKFAMGTMAS